jgi:hypothetical protein
MRRSVFVLALVLSASMATGCSSSEPSPEEKRNLFDKCVLDYIEANKSEINFIMEDVREQAPIECSYLLG